MTITRQPQPTPIQVLDAAYAGAGADVVHENGASEALAVHRWRADADAADHRLILDGCRGRVLDVGCGPGRLTQALITNGLTALGVDISVEAIRQARERGAYALHHDVFTDLPFTDWDCVLLADGNIGIGGDPVRMLRRAADLTRVTGRLFVEIAPSGGVAQHQVCLRVDSTVSEAFEWATVGVDAIDSVAGAAGLDVEDIAWSAGRCVAMLTRQSRR